MRPVQRTPRGPDTCRATPKAAWSTRRPPDCIEIWNLVFIQFNANPDGTFSPLPAKHVDTGMGFERVTGIMQNTQNFTDFTRIISNYETDIFRPIFNALEELSGKKYASTLPTAMGSTGDPPVAAGNLPAAPRPAGQAKPARYKASCNRSRPSRNPIFAMPILLE